jgi:hypothetical protein
MARLSAWLGNRSEGSGRVIPGGSGATIVSVGVSVQPTCERPDSVDERRRTDVDTDAHVGYSAGAAAMDTATTPGPGSPCTLKTPPTPGVIICLSAATTAPASWPTCAATARSRCRCAPWSPWPVNAGASRCPNHSCRSDHIDRQRISAPLRRASCPQKHT